MATQLRAFLSYSAANSTTHTLTKPTSPGTIVSGDLLLAFLIVNGSTAPSSVPSGWALSEQLFDSGSVCLYVYTKIAGGSEPASYAWTWASSILVAGGMAAAYSDTATSLKIDANDKQTNAFSANRVWPSLTTTVANDLLFFFGYIGSSSSTPDAACTERWDTGLAVRTYCMTEAIAAIGATGTRTATGAATSSKVISIAVGEVSSITGTADLTLDALTLSATGTVAVKGTADLTLGALTLVATGNVGSTPILGAGNLTLGTLTLSAEGTVGPVAPSNLTATAISGSRIDLTWDDDDPAAIAYSVERSANGLTGWTEIDVTLAKSYSNIGLTQNTTYYYRVRAMKL